jgi:hypothetical protein
MQAGTKIMKLKPYKQAVKYDTWPNILLTMNVQVFLKQVKLYNFTEYNKSRMVVQIRLSEFWLVEMKNSLKTDQWQSWTLEVESNGKFC